jgi:FkbM family methyltransferase
MNHIHTLGVTPKVIYDVGAAQGKWACLAASIWPSAHIIGFEPNRSNEPWLEQARCTLPRFEYLQCLLGASHQILQYTEKGNQTSLYESSDSGLAKATAEMLVLDELIAERRIPPPDFIKLDVQGYELEVLRGATQALSTCEALLLEVSFYREHPAMPTVDEVIQFLSNRGFRWFDVMGILRRPGNDALWQMDLYFLRADHPCWRAY